ncbi:DUF6493 family protein [uncultured Pseudoteredinibacter sp.]|uniref:DUF6493 family protein n=1 Tax=uncultured Pseudoteredinibacter sp. TaxID=1641701 RepID=UPI00260B37FC|nr:DUF6493 family protein [uncultured Pseudoteredinibacter sp.]
MSHAITYEKLESLVLSATPKEIRSTLSDYTEAQRKALSVKANKLRSQLCRNKANNDASDQLKMTIKSQGEYCWNGKAQINASIAAFALCPLSSLKTGNFMIYQDSREVWRGIISDRKPDWLDDWLAYDLDLESGLTSFKDVFAWIAEGICTAPTADGFIAKFAWEMMSIPRSPNNPPYTPISEHLKNNPILIEYVWRLFEVENQAFNTESWLRKGAPDNYETWTEALLKLSEEGIINRDKLLEASLLGLQNDIKQNQLSGIHKFHKNLEPTKAERQTMQSIYMDLLSHPIGHVAKFSLAMLSKIEKDGNLDKKKFLGESTSIFMREAKGNAASTLKMIKKINKSQADLREDSLRALLKGLKHSNIEIQEQALDLIEAEITPTDYEVIEELKIISQYSSAALRARLSRLSDSFESGENGKVEIELKDLEYVPLSKDIRQQEILQDLVEISPIKDIDELIISLSHAVEVVDSPDEVERIIDGISRLCDCKPKNFEDLVSPLKHRLCEGGGLANSNGIAVNWGGVQLSLADLILTWITGTLYRSPNDKYFPSTGTLIPAVRRIINIKDRVYKGESAQTLAAPTHTAGWIDPVVWVRRLNEMKPSYLEKEREDFCLSVIRLAPDKRELALGDTIYLPEKIRRIAQFALGGSLEISKADKVDYDLWISAARCRDPYKDWKTEFNKVGIKDSWPDSLQPAELTWKAYIHQNRNESTWNGTTSITEWKSPEFEISVGVCEIDKASPLNDLIGKIKDVIHPDVSTDWKKIPTAALSHTLAKQIWLYCEFNTPWVGNWLTYQWPQCPESAYVLGVRHLAARIDDNSSTWDPNFGFFFGLFAKKRHWGEASHLLLCLGLAGKDADARGLAIDAFIEGVDNRCLDVMTTARVLIQLSENGWLKLNRLGDNLMHISEASPMHSSVIREVLCKWLEKANPKQNNFFKILEVLYEVQIQIGGPVSANVQNVLSNIKGSNKAARTSKKILASLTA